MLAKLQDLLQDQYTKSLSESVDGTKHFQAKSHMLNGMLEHAARELIIMMYVCGSLASTVTNGQTHRTTTTSFV